MRGTGGDVLIGEELAFMSPDFFKQVIVPIFAARASFIGITTLGFATNFVNRLFDLTNSSGHPIFNSVRVSTVCDRCRQLGLESTCQHLIHEIPPWQSESNVADVQEILKNDRDTLLREAKGEQPNSTMLQIFPTDTVKKWRTQICPKGTSHPLVYVTIDPNAGGKSEFAVVSCFYDGTNDENLVVKKFLYFFCIFPLLSSSLKKKKIKTNGIPLLDVKTLNQIKFRGDGRE